MVNSSWSGSGALRAPSSIQTTLESAFSLVEWVICKPLFVPGRQIPPARQSYGTSAAGVIRDCPHPEQLVARRRPPRGAAAGGGEKQPPTRGFNGLFTVKRKSRYGDPRA